ncbi:hypothetical protein VTJ49DRAFT_3919 [Mycothermus thermophilus]|uniref:Uncharacterized protein n=1 Tax=Humicola insolens TaxID=85995 RepID=A0ABR3VMH8_HUMIN
MGTSKTSWERRPRTPATAYSGWVGEVLRCRHKRVARRWATVVSRRLGFLPRFYPSDNLRLDSTTDDRFTSMGRQPVCWIPADRWTQPRQLGCPDIRRSDWRMGSAAGGWESVFLEGIRDEEEIVWVEEGFVDVPLSIPRLVSALRPPQLTPLLSGFIPWMMPQKHTHGYRHTLTLPVFLVLLSLTLTRS